MRAFVISDCEVAMSCSINPLTGRRFCDERREALAAKSKAAAAAARAGNVGAVISNAGGAVKHAAIGSAELARNAAISGMTFISGRGFFVRSGNRRDDNNG